MKKLVIMPGGYHPFHQGHLALYDAARKAFPDADIYVAATNDTGSRPFPFAVKQKLAKLAGVPADKFVQVKSPFKANEITQNYDPNDTALIFVRSDKDRDQQPKPGGVKKDGTPSYLQPYTNENLKPMSEHGYMAYLPTVEFAGGLTSATEIRSQWPGLITQGKAKLVNQLYPRTAGNQQLTDTVIKLIDQALSVPVAEAAPSFTDKFKDLLERNGLDRDRSDEYMAKMQAKLAKQREKVMNKYVKENKEFQWTDTDSIQDMDVRMQIVEHILLSELQLITESVDQHKVEYVQGLKRFAVAPVTGQPYMFTMLSVTGNQVSQIQKPEVVVCLEVAPTQVLVRRKDGSKSWFPDHRLSSRVLLESFFFDNTDNFKKFNAELSLIMPIKENQPQEKPRNFVAKNAMATTSGAGVHKDKKKAVKQGDQKHRQDLKRSVDYIDEATYRAGG